MHCIIIVHQIIERDEIYCIKQLTTRLKRNDYIAHIANDLLECNKCNNSKHEIRCNLAQRLAIKINIKYRAVVYNVNMK